MKSGISRLALASSSFLAIGVSLAAAQSVIVQVDTSSAAAAIEELADAFAIEQLNEGDEAATIADEITDGLFAITGTVSANALQDVSGNPGDATAIGNISNTLLDDSMILTGGGAGIGTAQVNSGNLISSNVSIVRIGGLVNIDGGQFTDTFTVRDNSLDSVAVGNQNTAGLHYDNVSLVSPAADLFASIAVTTGSDPAMTEVIEASHVIANAQANIDNSIDGKMHTIVAGISFPDDVAGAILVTEGNSFSASSTGNIADLAFQAKTDANFHADAFIANAQGNFKADITTAVSGPIQIGISVGAIRAGTSAVVADNAVEGLAVGNQMAAAMRVESTDLKAGLGISNVQFDSDTPITTEVGDIFIGATTLGGAIESSTVVVDGNSVQSGARGNVAETSVELETVSAGGTRDAFTDFSFLRAFIPSYQFTDGEVSASINGVYAGITGGAAIAAVDASVLTVAGNRSQSSAIANGAVHSISAQIVEALAGTDLGIGSGAKAIIGYSSANAAFSLINAQLYAAGVSASNTSSQFGLIEIGSVDGSVLALNGNVIGALARGNVALGDGDAYGNSIDIDIVELATLSGNGDNIAALANRQENGGDVTATTSNARIGTTDEPLDISDSTATASGNLIYAIAEGSLAENHIRFTGVSYAGGYPGATAVVTGTGLIDREFALLNYQAESSDPEDEREVTATVSAFSIDIDVSTLSDSVAAVSDNVVQAQARDNNAVSLLDLGGENGLVDLTATGAVVNEQSTTASITASISAGFIDIGSSDSTDASTLVTSGNLLDARAEGNRATSAISVAAVNLGSSVGSTSAGASNTGGASALADYAVLNAQSSEGPIGASVSDTIVGVMVGTGMSSTLSAVTGNQMRATGVANAAHNQIALASAAVSGASAAIASTQYNSSPVLASIADVTIGIIAGTSASGSANVVRGNQVGAAAVGNSVTNRISRSGY